MYIIYNAWAQKQLSKVPFHMMDNLAEIKIILKTNKRKTEHANNDVTRQGVSIGSDFIH